MCCVGGVVRKLGARQEVTGSSPGCGVNFFALHRPSSPSVGTETNDPDL
jgi:hypothetical protein